jgi:hypothetical protein
MAASSNIATQLLHWRTLSPSGVALIRNNLEAATQSFLQGTPVQLSGGYLQACATINSVATAVIAGISTVPGASLASSGVAKTQNLTYSVPNQPNAVVIPLGAPPNDGTSQFLLANPAQYFVGTVGNSNTAANATLAITMLGGIFGLTKDAGNGFWYIDNFITTAAAGACVEIVNLISPVGTLNGLVEFRITLAASQLTL